MTEETRVDIDKKDWNQSQDKLFENFIYYRAAARRMEVTIFSSVNMLGLLSMAAGRDDDIGENLVMDDGEKQAFLELLEQTREKLVAAAVGVEWKAVKAAIEDLKKQMAEHTVDT